MCGNCFGLTIVHVIFFVATLVTGFSVEFLDRGGNGPPLDILQPLVSKTCCFYTILLIDSNSAYSGISAIFEVLYKRAQKPPNFDFNLSPYLIIENYFMNTRVNVKMFLIFQPI